MGVEFFKTGMGRKFFESDFPELIRQLQRIADALEKVNELKEAEN